MAGRTGITHYAWPGGLAMVIETPASRAAAVFGPAGWRIGPAGEVLADGAPEGAQMVHLALPEVLAGQVALLQPVGSSLHTDFVHLDKLVAKLQAEGGNVALFVLGRAPAALVVLSGRVAVIEPAHEPVDEVLTGADGWIVVGLGTVRLPATAEPPTAHPQAGTRRVGAAPAASRTEPESVHSDSGHPSAEPAHAPAEAAPDRVAAPPGAFGRFAPEARFVLAAGAADRLPAEASAKITDAAGDAGPVLMGLLDGAHTLSEIAAATGLGHGAVAAVVEILMAHRLVFRYVSRVRPPTGASTPG